MPEITTCPDCDKKLKVPDDLLGRKVRCPGCSVLFTAQPDPVEEEAPVGRGAQRRDGYSARHPTRDDCGEHDDRDRPRRRDDEEDRPRRRDDYDDDRGPRRSSPLKGWRGTRTGVFLVIISNWIYLGALGVLILGGGVLMLAGASLFAGFAGAPPGAASMRRTGAGMFGMATGAFLLVGILGLMMLASWVLELIGQGLCLQVPTRRSSNAARVLAIIAFVCSCLAFLFDGGYYFASYNAGIFGLNGLVHTAAFVLWIVFLRTVALECRDPDLAQRLIVFLISSFVAGALVATLFVVLVCGGALAISGAGASDGPSGAAGAAGAAGVLFLAVMVLFGLGFVGMLVWYGLLMQQAREAISRHLSRL